MRNIYQVCGHCNGTGINNMNPGGSVPCGQCAGTGHRDFGLIDLSDIETFCAEAMKKLDYIHGKVTAIWNQVKPGN